MVANRRPAFADGHMLVCVAVLSWICVPRLFAYTPPAPAINAGSIQSSRRWASESRSCMNSGTPAGRSLAFSITASSLGSLCCLAIMHRRKERSAATLCGQFSSACSHCERDVSRGAMKLTYFGLWAKGPSCALALEHSGMDWEGVTPQDWKSMKATTPFLELPILEVTDVGTIGHELAILNYIGQQAPEMGGSSPKDFVVSQQLMNQAEDIYQKLSKLKTGYITGGDAEAVWTDEDEQTHNRNFGMKVFLKLLEAFYTKCGGEAGKFTSSGKTVGECKLFSSLHALKLIKDDILAAYPGLTAFYDRFAAEAPTQAILNGTGKMSGTFSQYFKFDV
eukprot:TRINITY_DN68056_c0_g1_i1.p1 TRINITY_DN68056_c0_g1~~TRINITY_DN68056_c0_g1_i1.p1  ORF type:complete len:336 (+),score=51.53 TRINITY_DN68056_c0_g1_i1:67-1074(+)